MALNKYKLGELIEQTTENNSLLEFGKDDVKGMTITKEIIPTKANIDETSFEKYLIVRPNNFIYNPRTHGKKIGLGFNNSAESFIITWNNIAFRLKKDAARIILPLFLFLHFNRSEWDREACFNSWGSSTEVFPWDTFCDMEIKLPDITIQQKYANVYNTMIANRQTYESGLADLNIAIAASIEEFKHTAPCVAVGELIEETDARNHDGAITNVQGININKEFMPSVANLSETDLTNYKVVEKNQFAYSAMQTGRDKCIRIALFHENEPVIISPAYSVLQVKDESVLAEYIMLWFSRSESDRYGWFISDSSIRSSLELPRFYEIEIPLPPLPRQEAVVNFYNARQLILRNITAMGNMLKDICPILIKGAMEEGKVR
jgi:type I restriction enzyme S subunit